MTEHQRYFTQISIDLKKYRIRIHKDSLRLIGDPDYIQLLVNTETRQVAIRAVERATAGSHAHKIARAKVSSDSCEIYSRPFCGKLCSDFDCFHAGASYRLTGIVVPDQNAAVFSLSSAQLIESEDSQNGR